MGGPRPRGWAPAELASCSFLGSWVGGWAAAWGSHWAPFMFPFSAFGSDGWAAVTGLGSDWAPFMFLSHLLRRGAGLVLGSLHVPFLAWVGWVGRGHGAALSLGSLHVPFWVGWVGRGHGAGLPLGSLHLHASLHVPFSAPGSDGWAAATGLGSRWAPFMFLSRLLGRWAGRGHGAGLYVPFSAGSDGWAAVTGLGLRWAPFMFLSRLGSGGWAAATGLGSDWAPFMFLSGLLGWMGGPRPLCSFLCSDGQAAARRLGSQKASLHISFPGSWVGWAWMGGPLPRLPAAWLGRMMRHQQFGLSLGMWVGWLGRSQEAGFCWAPFILLSLWVAAKKLGLHWASYISFLGSSGSDG